MPALTASYAGLVNGDTPASLSTAPTLSTVPASSHAGTYAITASGAVDADYTISYVAGTLTIQARTPNADRFRAAISFAGTEFTSSGLINGDSVTGADAPPAERGLGRPARRAVAIPLARSRQRTEQYAITVNGALTVQSRRQLTSGNILTNCMNVARPSPLTATVAARRGSSTPTGTVAFYDATTGMNLGSVSLAGALWKSELRPRQSARTALPCSTSGDSNFQPSTTV